MALARAGDRHHEKANAVKEALLARGIRVEVDNRSEKIGYKIREAQLQKIPYMLVLGDKEVEDGTLSVRRRGQGDLGSMSVDALCDKLLAEIAQKARD